MTTNYPIGDFLIRIKNTALAKKHTLVVPETKLIKAVANLLKNEGVVDSLNSKQGLLTLNLTYKSKEPVLMGLKLISKPGLRVYMNKDEIKKANKGSSFLIISTSSGMLSSKKALEKGIGGEIIAEIW